MVFITLITHIEFLSVTVLELVFFLLSFRGWFASNADGTRLLLEVSDGHTSVTFNAYFVEHNSSLVVASEGYNDKARDE